MLVDEVERGSCHDRPLLAACPSRLVNYAQGVTVALLLLVAKRVVRSRGWRAPRESPTDS